MIVCLKSEELGQFSVNVFVGSSDTVDIEMLGYLSDPMSDAYYFAIFLC